MTIKLLAAWLTGSLATSLAALLATLLAPAMAAPAQITIDDRMVFPESLGSSADGTLYIGGMATARIYRARPGADHAEPFISKEQGGFTRVLGVLADSKSNTLFVCDNNGTQAALKTFALDSGKKRESYGFPGGGTCNDIALKGGDAYLTDTAHGRVLKLAKGARELSVWYSNPDDPSLDGLVWARDGQLYTNTYRTHHLIRIAVKADGSAGAGTVLKTSMPIYQPDGMRLSSDGRILMVEGQGRPDAGPKEGRVDEVIPRGDSAVIRVIRSGFELPTAVTAVGRTLWVLEAKLDYQRNAGLKGKDPGSFKVYAVPMR